MKDFSKKTSYFTDFDLLREKWKEIFFSAKATMALTLLCHDAKRRTIDA